MTFVGWADHALGPCNLAVWWDADRETCLFLTKASSLLRQVSIPYPDGTHVGFEDQVVLGDAEVVPDILPWLSPLLLWLITALSSLGVPFLPYALGQIYKQRRLAAEGPADPAGSGGSTAIGASAGGGLLGAPKPGEERALARLDRLFGKLLVNPLDIALLEQQAARKETPRLFKVGFFLS